MSDHNPKKKEHQDLEEKILETLQNSSQPVPTPELAEKISYDKYGWTQTYFRNQRLPQALNKLKDEGSIEVKKQTRNGGHPTYNWGVK